jgi:hypothetical protein
MVLILLPSQLVWLTRLHHAVWPWYWPGRYGGYTCMGTQLNWPKSNFWVGLTVWHLIPMTTFTFGTLPTSVSVPVSMSVSMSIFIFIFMFMFMLVHFELLMPLYAQTKNPHISFTVTLLARLYQLVNKVNSIVVKTLKPVQRGSITIFFISDYFHRTSPGALINHFIYFWSWLW